MRLVDADALKEELAKNITIWTFNVSYDGILAEIIDNTPTVEIPNYGGQIVPDMLQGWRYEERPQGEWITFPTSRLIMQCPKCTAFLSRTRSDIFKDSIGEMNFCPNCGADMRGEEP